MKFWFLACISVQLPAWSVCYPIEEDLSTQILSVVEDLRSKKSDTFDCLIYLPHSSSYAEQVVQRLLSSATFADIPVLQLGRHFEDPTVFRPIWEAPLVVAFLDTPDQRVELCKYFQQKSNYVVVFEWTTQSQFDALASYMSHSQVTYVTYVTSEGRATVIHRERSQGLNSLLVSAVENKPFTNFEEEQPSGVDIELVKIVAEKLNKSIAVSQVIRNKSDSLSRRTSPNTINLDRTIGVTASVGYVAALSPTVVFIMVPCSVSYNMFEFIRKPIHNGLLILIVCLMIAAVLVMYRRPNLFQNNLILLPWFNFERYSLHRTGRLERFVMIALIVLTFFIRIAFENTLISSIATTTASSEFKNLKELQQSGWKMKTNLWIESRILLKDPQWTPVLEYEARMKIVSTRKSAYMITSELYRGLEVVWHDSGFRRKFMILPEKLYFGYGMYDFGSTYGIIDQFESMQRWLYDTGIYSFLQSLVKENYRRFMKRRLMLKKSFSVTSFIAFKDMMIARWVLMVGWIASLGACLLELLFRQRRSKAKLGAEQALKQARGFRKRNNSFPGTTQLEKNLCRRHTL